MPETILAGSHLPDPDVLVAADSRVQALVEVAPPIRERLAVNRHVAGMPHCQRDENELPRRVTPRHGFERLTQPRTEPLGTSVLAPAAHEVLSTRIPPHVAAPRTPTFHDAATARAPAELVSVRAFERSNALERVGSLQRRAPMVGRPRAPSLQDGRHAFPVAPLGHLLRLWAR